MERGKARVTLLPTAVVSVTRGHKFKARSKRFGMGIWRFGRDYLEGGTGRYSSNIRTYLEQQLNLHGIEEYGLSAGKCDVYR